MAQNRQRALQLRRGCMGETCNEAENSLKCIL